MQVMQGTIVEFIHAQEMMSKKHVDGWISERMNTSKFHGSYRTMAEC